MTTRAARRAMESAEAARPMGQRFVARVRFRVAVDGRAVEVAAGDVLSAPILNAVAAKLNRMLGVRMIRTEYFET